MGSKSDERLSVVLSNIKNYEPYYEEKRAFMAQKEEMAVKWAQRQKYQDRFKKMENSDSMYNLIFIEEYIDQRLREIEKLYHKIFPYGWLRLDISRDSISMRDDFKIDTYYDLYPKRQDGVIETITIDGEVLRADSYIPEDE